MRLIALSVTRRIALSAALAAVAPFASISIQAQADPPAQVGRISVVSGAVSVQPAGVDGWGEAVPNLPLGPGGRIYTNPDAKAEVQIGQTFVRIGPNTDFTLVNSTPEGLYFGVAQGSIHLQVMGLWPDQSIFVQTPSGSSTLTTTGQMRVDVMPEIPAAVFTSFGVNLFVNGAGGYQQTIANGQSLELGGTNPVMAQWLEPGSWDPLDDWSHHRDEEIQASQSYQYVSQEIPGAYELDGAGTWEPGTEYGAVWFPNNVPEGWAPYHYGHWVNRSPWGWVWVEQESWGYAPFHYGRWVSYGGRWGWIPGPREAHPVWSPALVVFAGGIHIGGGGVSVWFPLGPGEPYRPWYPCSPRYIDSVNISNIRESPRVHVQTTYVNINVTNITYVNRTVGVAAMSNEDFASGRPAHEASVTVNVNLMEHVQPLPAPEPRATVISFVGKPPVHPVPVSTERPVLINERGKAVAARPGAQPSEPPVKAISALKPLPGRKVIAAPAKPMPAPEKPTAVTAKPVPVPAKPVAAQKTMPAGTAKPPAKPTAPGAASKPAAPAAKRASPGPKTAKPANPPAKTDKDKDKTKDDKTPS